MTGFEDEKLYTYEEKQYLGQIVQVVPALENKFQLVRVISTDPSVYLNPEFQPGTILAGNTLS
jgi:hypothetical protein